MLFRSRVVQKVRQRKADAEEGDDEADFFGPYQLAVERLPNGNYLLRATHEEAAEDTDQTASEEPEASEDDADDPMANALSGFFKTQFAGRYARLILHAPQIVRAEGAMINKERTRAEWKYPITDLKKAPPTLEAELSPGIGVLDMAFAVGAVIVVLVGVGVVVFLRRRAA